MQQRGGGHPSRGRTPVFKFCELSHKEFHAALIDSYALGSYIPIRLYMNLRETSDEDCNALAPIDRAGLCTTGAALIH